MNSLITASRSIVEILVSASCTSSTNEIAQERGPHVAGEETPQRVHHARRVGEARRILVASASAPESCVSEMTAAHKAGHPEVMLMILSDQIGCFAHMEAPDETP